MNHKERYFLALVIVNQSLWIANVVLRDNNYKKLARETRYLYEFKQLLVKKIQEHDPEILRDPEIVDFIFKYEFDSIVDNL